MVAPSGMSGSGDSCPTTSPAVLEILVTVGEPFVSVPVKQQAGLEDRSAPVVAVTLPPLVAVLTVASTPASTPPSPRWPTISPSGRCSNPATDQPEPRLLVRGS